MFVGATVSGNAKGSRGKGAISSSSGEREGGVGSGCSCRDVAGMLEGEVRQA